MPSGTIGAAIERALDAYAGLDVLGEEIEDEWSYVTDLVEAWGARFEATVAARGEEVVSGEVDAAIDRIIDEIGRIVDPHRAIDWLSTFPQVVLVAMGERP